LDQVSLAPGRSQEAEPRGSALSLAPSIEATWALICGYLASGLGRWEGADALRVATTWLLADATMGCVFAQLVGLKRSRLAADGPQRRESASSFSLGIPYAVTGAPGQRFALRVNKYLFRWREQVWPRARPHAFAAIVAVALALVMATYLSREVFAAVGGGLLAAGCLAVVSRNDDALLACWLAGLHPALAWSLGHLSVPPWRPSALAAGAVMGLAAYARARLEAGRSALALWILGAVSALLVAVLLMLGQPVLAAVAAAAALADNMRAGERPKDGQVASPPGRLGWLVASLFASLAVAWAD